MLRPSLAVVRQSEDSFVDRIFAGVVDLGIPLLIAHFPRSYIDANRAPYELDPDAIADPLPPYAEPMSRYVQCGLGSVATRAPDGGPLYRSKLRFAEVEQRLQECYFPYHAALQKLITETQQRFGYCLLLDCHSMPARPFQTKMDRAPLADFVLGDRHGQSCRREIRDRMGQLLTEMGYCWAANDPYAGGYVLKQYGRTKEGVDALQIEISKSLYMDERKLTPNRGIADLTAHIQAAIGKMGGYLLKKPDLLSNF